MSTLDGMVQKFKFLKEKLKGLTNDPHCIRPNIKINNENVMSSGNQANKNKVVKKTQVEVEDAKDLTQKKGRHRKAFSNHQQANRQPFILIPNQRKRSLNNSRVKFGNQESECDVYDEKDKTLQEINNLLERKRQILEKIQKKIGSERLMDEKHKKYGKVYLGDRGERSGKKIKAPNLFELQAEGRKKGYSKPMSLMWK